MNTPSTFDAINHAPGVRVYPLPAPRNQLTATQVKNCRRYSHTEGVLRRIALCRPVGLGMASTVRTLPSPIVPTHNSAPGTVRPGSRRRGHARASANTCFSGKSVTARQEHDREAARALDQLRKMPNVGTSLTTCASGTSVTANAPVGVSATSVTGPDGSAAAQVAVTYLTPVFIPMLTQLPKQVTMTRTVQMRVN